MTADAHAGRAPAGTTPTAEAYTPGEVAPAAKAAILVEALPYIRRFWGQVVVVKYGGNALAGSTVPSGTGPSGTGPSGTGPSGTGPSGTGHSGQAALASFATDIVLMRSVGMRPLVVHGGGPQIGELMTRLGKVPEFIDGLRVTDAETLDIARMVLVGKVNRDIVSAINVHAPLAVGVSGEDAGLISAEARDPLLGFVGDVTAVNPDLLNRLLAEDLIPVLATIGSDATGQAYNINADTAAGAVAEAVGATKLVYLTDVDGIRANRHDPASRLSSATTDQLGAMLGNGTVDGGMIPKVQSCVRAVNGGVAQAHILDGRHEHAVLLEIFTREGVGTMVTRPPKHTMTAPSQPEHRLMATYPPTTVTFVRGAGSLLWDDRGREYLDFLCGLAVTSLGHAHPAVAEAVCTQAQTLLHVSNLFGTVPQREVAATLDRLIDAGPGRVFFCNSGAEANECAIKLARRWGGRGRHVVISAYGSFHGRTLATLHATGQPAKHEPFQPLPEGFRHVAWRDLDALASALEPAVAGVLLEPVQGEGGVNPAGTEYFEGVRRLCDERGALLMVDEVQTGLGRTGRWFGFQHYGIQPDVVTVAKALGNGVPIGACWARDDVAMAFGPGDHATTFGGQPLAASAARAVLAVMEAEDVPGRARAAGAYLTAALENLPEVAAVRGQGLLIAAELTEGKDAGQVAAAALDAGLVINAVTPTALRLAPSLLVTEHEIDRAVTILGAALDAAMDADSS